MSPDVLFAKRLEALVGPDLSGLHLCAAFSGGLDSSVLLYLLAQCAPRLGFKFSAAHVHHGISPHADAWAAHCECFAQSLNVPLFVRRINVERQSADGLEAAARRARHAVFAALDCDWIVLAHHRGDQAETVLHRLMRGSGVHGAAGMRAKDASRRLLRPLLDQPRAALLAWAQEKGLDWIEDESNADTRFTRNFLRNEVLPLLKTRQAGIEVNLARSAALFEESAGLLDQLALEDALRINPGESGSLNALRELDVARARNLLRFLLVQAGALPPTMERLVEALRQIHQAQEALRLPFDGVFVCVWRDAFWIERDVVPTSQKIIWQGEPRLAWSGGSLNFVPGVGPTALRIKPDGNAYVALRQGGERLRVHASGPTRQFKQLAQEAQIPPWQRERLPCLWQGDALVWIAELGVSAEWVCADHEPGWRVEWISS